MGPDRRTLKFTTFDEVVADAEYLLAAGYTTVGKWDLAQCCGHLAEWLTYPVAGFPMAPLPIRLMLRLMRATMGRKMFEKALRDGFGTGKPTIPQSVPAAGGDDRAAVERLKAAAERFRAHPGEYLPSPLFGQLSREDATRLQLGHAAHHLSFLVPKA